MFEHLTPGRNLCKSMQEEHGNARNMEVHTTLFADKKSCEEVHLNDEWGSDGALKMAAFVLLVS